MNIYIIAVGKNMPDWVVTGFKSYADRMPSDYDVRLIEIVPEKRPKHADIQQIALKEEEKIHAAIPKNTYCVALDRIGKTIDTKTLAKNLQTWHDSSQDICFVIGGPEGLSQSFLQQSQMIWSLSALTLPHPMVRVILSEQLYRAWSIIINHPYHR